MEKHFRKLNRLKDYDYSSNGLYFITICTKDRFPYLSEIIYDEKYVNDFDSYLKEQNNRVGDGVLDVPHVKLKDYGIIVNDQINEMNSIYKKLKIIKYVIMPDHVHMIIYLFDKNNVIGGTPRAAFPTKSVSQIINALKTISTKQIGFSLWQKSFHDHIIRSEKEFLEICGYIDNNPINWVNHIYNQNFWR